MCSTHNEARWNRSFFVVGRTELIDVAEWWRSFSIEDLQSAASGQDLLESWFASAQVERWFRPGTREPAYMYYEHFVNHQNSEINCLSTTGWSTTRWDNSCINDADGERCAGVRQFKHVL